MVHKVSLYGISKILETFSKKIEVNKKILASINMKSYLKLILKQKMLGSPIMEEA